MDQSQIKALLNSTASATTTFLKQAGPQIKDFVQAHPKKSAFAGASLIAWPLGGTAAVAGTLLKWVVSGSAGPIAGKGKNI
jgi:hypothetical protein